MKKRVGIGGKKRKDLNGPEKGKNEKKKKDRENVECTDHRQSQRML